MSSIGGENLLEKFKNLFKIVFIAYYMFIQDFIQSGVMLYVII